MRVARFVLCFLLAFASSPRLNSQQSTTAVQRDPQAIALLSQALTASGSATLTASLHDFTASGSITYFWAGSQVQGTATIRALGITSFRVDATLPEGVRSWVTTQDQGSIRETNGQVSPILWHNTIHLGALTLPQWKIANVLNDWTLSVQYSGTDSFSGHQVAVIRVQKPTDASTDPGGIFSHLSAMDFLIDVATYQVIGVRDALHPLRDSMQDIRHEIAFADFRVVNGSLVPFSITETIAGQETWSLRLDVITFNTGLTNADFQL
jgi:hypothetical protein